MNPKDIILSFEELTNFCFILTLEFVDFQLCWSGCRYTTHIWTHMIKQLLYWHEICFPPNLSQIQRPGSISFIASNEFFWKSDFTSHFSLVDISFSQHLLTTKIMSSKTSRWVEHFEYPQCVNICSRSTYNQHFFTKKCTVTHLKSIFSHFIFPVIVGNQFFSKL